MVDSSPLGFNTTNDVVQKALDGHWARHSAISSNLANVETPDYKRRTVHFEGQLKKALAQMHRTASNRANNNEQLAFRRTNPFHAQTPCFVQSLDDVEPTIVVDEMHSVTQDDNGVDVEIEMVTLAENTEHYIALNNIQGRMMKGVKGVLNGVQG